MTDLRLHEIPSTPAHNRRISMGLIRGSLEGATPLQSMADWFEQMSELLRLPLADHPGGNRQANGQPLARSSRKRTISSRAFATAASCSSSMAWRQSLSTT